MDILGLYRNTGDTARQMTAGEWAGPCPSCGGDDRFRLFLGQGKDGLGRYWCRRCETSGDCIQFLRNFKGLTFREACQEMGWTPEDPTEYRQGQARTKPDWKPRESISPTARWRSKALALVEWAAAQLREREDVFTWLESERSLTTETIRTARLGWSPTDEWPTRKDWGLPEEAKADGRPKKLWLPRGITIPVFSVSGKIQRIKVRRPNPKPQEARYIPLPTEPKNTAPMILDNNAAVDPENRTGVIG